MYLASLDQVGKHRSLDVEWKAFELQPRERPRSPEEQELMKEYIARGWPQVERMARDVYGLEMKQGPVGIDTRLAHVATAVAAHMGQGDAFMRRVFEAYWKEGRDVGDRDVLVSLAEAVGLDGDAFARSLDDEQFWTQVREEQNRARQLGLSAVPATVVAGRYSLSGCRPPEDLQALFRRMELEGGLGS